MTSASSTARTRARIEITGEILAAARVRLTHAGPGELSLRAVARDVGMVSSAVYRYFASRDDLLTALLIEAYNELGAAAETADASVAERTDFVARWVAACHAIRDWSVAHPGDYALLYGTPVPGYAAPKDTISAAVRATSVLVDIVITAHQGRDAELETRVGSPQDLEKMLAGALEFLGQRAEPTTSVNAELAMRTIAAWTAIFGTISFEMFGHLVGSVDDYNAYFDQVVRRLAAELEL
ncbi:MAG: TetR/AcrR family transcriptional regulator [Nocardioidaceae bacterium]|nr:TetR/AcrR family transcriptional regulator [Nocardioidaceae bacterium]